MAVSLPNGGTFAVASSYAAPIAVSAISNASPAVATSNAHGLANGDIIELTSGWSRLNNKIVRVSGVTTNTFNLEGIDTTNTQIYPAGSGAGSVRKVLTWAQVPQITGATTAGGEQQYVNYQFLEDDQERQLPTTKSAQSLTLTIGDDPNLPGYQELVKASNTRSQRAIWFNLANGSKIYYNGYVSVNETPTVNANEIMTVSAAISQQSTPTRYAS